MKLSSGHTAVDLEGEELKRYERDFVDFTKGLVRLQPGRWLFPKAYTQFADKIYNMEWIPTDVCIMTYPKCGTTWMQEIIWTMRNNPNLDNPKHSDHLFVRSPFLESDMLRVGVGFGGPENNDPNDPIKQSFHKMCPGKNIDDGLMIQLAEALPKPRTIKTHFPFSLLSPKLLDNAKVVFVARNPKDAIVSFHHHHRLFRGLNYKGTFEDFVKYFVADDLLFGPYWLMLKEAWERRSHPNMHIIFYEDLKADIKGELRKLDAFIGTGLTDKQMDNVIEWTSFNSMKDRREAAGGNKGVGVNQEVLKKDGGFLRKGVTGDWKIKFTPELEALVDDWTQKHLGDLGMQFKYTI